jgi:hypothetical protein
MYVPFKCKSNVEPGIAGPFLLYSGSLLVHYTITIFTIYKPSKSIPAGKVSIWASQRVELREKGAFRTVCSIPFS